MKFVVPAAMILVGVLQTVHYRRLVKVFDMLPVVAGEVLESKLFDDPWTDPNRRVFEARIKFKYRFRGEDYTSDTPALRGYQLWPSYFYEYDLLKKYKKGDLVNVKVHPDVPRLAYLEVAPFDKKSAVLMPFLSLWYIALVLLYMYFIERSLL